MFLWFNHKLYRTEFGYNVEKCVFPKKDSATRFSTTQEVIKHVKSDKPPHVENDTKTTTAYSPRPRSLRIENHLKCLYTW